MKTSLCVVDTEEQTAASRERFMNHQSKKTIVITGGTGGIGFQSALALAKLDCNILISGRNHERGMKAVTDIKKATSNPSIHFIQGDLSSIGEIDKLASTLLTKTNKIDVLINNAGYLGSEPCQSPDDVEMHFAVNVLAPWRLSHALLPALKASEKARIINVTGGDKPARIDPDNIQAEKGFKGLMTYTHSKSVMECMSIILANQFEKEGITVNVVFPGRASTAMTRSFTLNALPGAMKLMYPFFRFFFREDGGKPRARTST